MKLRKLLAICLIFFSILVLISIYKDIAWAELKYRWRGPQPQIAVVEVTKEDREFTISIPKIEVSAEVIPGVDPFKKEEYQKALKKGVALALGSALPDEEGSTFIFAHSTGNPWEVTKYNAIFYLLGKLEEGDEIYLFFKGQSHRYKVSGKKVVDASEINYLKSTESDLVLMTCWPPGTTFKRLLVLAQKE